MRCGALLLITKVGEGSKTANMTWEVHHAAVMLRGGVGKNFARIFFSYPPPLQGYPPKKKLAPHVGIFFCQEEFFYCVLLELACHLHFGTLYDIGT